MKEYLFYVKNKGQLQNTINVGNRTESSMNQTSPMSPSKTMNSTFRGTQGHFRQRSECNPYDDPNRKKLKVFSDETLEKDF